MPALFYCLDGKKGEKMPLVDWYNIPTYMKTQSSKIFNKIIFSKRVRGKFYAVNKRCQTSHKYWQFLYHKTSVNCYLGWRVPYLLFIGKILWGGGWNNTLP